MHRSLRYALMLLVCLSSATYAAVAYDFRQSHRSERGSSIQSDAQGKGLIEGDRSRVEFTGGNLYPAGAFIISRRGANSVIFANPETKAYAEVNLAALTRGLGSGEVEINNVRTKSEQLPDHPTVSGLPTDHYRTETSYEVTVRGGAMTLTQNVHTVVEKWTTNAFGDVTGAFLDVATFRTGNTEIDKVLDAELSKVKGLPLRTVTTVTTSAAGNLARGRLAPPKRVQVSEILLSNVRIETAPTGAFELPAGYTKAEGKAPEQSRVQMLDMETAKP